MISRTRLALLLAATLAVAGCGARAGSAVPASATSADGFPLPEVTLQTLDGAAAWETTSLASMPAVINLWATWCAPCVEEMPALEAVHVEVGDRVRFVGVNRADVTERARELAARTGVTYELVSDPDSVFFVAVGARAMPTTLFVDARGNVVHAHAGPLDEAALRRLISTHLGV